MEATGRRVFDDIENLSKPGDYTLGGIDDHGEHKRAVWFLLPIHEGVDKTDPEDGHIIPGMYHRPTEGSGLHMVTEPPWTFRECDDGSVEIRASILCGKTDDRPEGYFHGFLNEGHRWSW